MRYNHHAIMQNQFVVLIENGKISSEHDLKKIFWRLALKCHPDSGSMHNGEELFKKLKADYDAARRFLVARKAPKTASSRIIRKTAANPADCARAFADLVSSNFPVARSVRATNKNYRVKLAAFVEAFDAAYGPRVGKGRALVNEFERELYEIRGDNIVWNELFGKIILIFYNICSYYHLKSALTKRAIPRWFAEISKELPEKGFGATLEVLGILIGDMEKISL